MERHIPSGGVGLNIMSGCPEKLRIGNVRTPDTIEILKILTAYRATLYGVGNNFRSPIPVTVKLPSQGSGCNHVTDLQIRNILRASRLRR